MMCLGGLCQAFEDEFAGYSQIWAGDLGRDEGTTEGAFKAGRLQPMILDCHLWGASRRKRLEAGDLGATNRRGSDLYTGVWWRSELECQRGKTQP